MCNKRILTASSILNGPADMLVHSASPIKFILLKENASKPNQQDLLEMPMMPSSIVRLLMEIELKIS